MQPDVSPNQALGAVASAIIGAGLAGFAANGEFIFDTYGQNLLYVGGPIAISAMVANWGLKSKGENSWWALGLRGILGGAGAVAILIIAGQMERQVDAATINMAVICGASILAGDYLVDMLDG